MRNLTVGWEVLRNIAIFFQNKKNKTEKEKLNKNCEMFSEHKNKKKQRYKQQILQRKQSQSQFNDSFEQ